VTRDVRAGDAPAGDARGLRFLIAASRFHRDAVERLVTGASDLLQRHGAAATHVETVWVPGALELPLACRWGAATGRFDAIIAVGVVLKGETEHFRLVADQSAAGFARVAFDTGVPVLNGVLAAHHPGQVADRSGGLLGNRGAEAALAAIQMARLRRAQDES
jgi:6,7-dimethyl-8-ribityllumazine synthase